MTVRSRRCLRSSAAYILLACFVLAPLSGCTVAGGIAGSYLESRTQEVPLENLTQEMVGDTLCLMTFSRKWYCGELLSLSDEDIALSVIEMNRSFRAEGRVTVSVPDTLSRHSLMALEVQRAENYYGTNGLVFGFLADILITSWWLSDFDLGLR